MSSALVAGILFADRLGISSNAAKLRLLRARRTLRRLLADRGYERPIAA
jgi:DNA-directed RNA polymerase specialized sigma24 family protein